MPLNRLALVIPAAPPLQAKTKRDPVHVLASSKKDVDARIRGHDVRSLR